MKKQSEIKKVSALLRKDRLSVLGGFGMKQQKVKASKKAYDRKKTKPINKEKT